MFAISPLFLCITVLFIYTRSSVIYTHTILYIYISNSFIYKAAYIFILVSYICLCFYIYNEIFFYRLFFLYILYDTNRLLWLWTFWISLSLLICLIIICILCSHFMLITLGEVIPMVLTIYMVDPNLPLPSRNEVLLCTDHTTKEEVRFE